MVDVLATISRSMAEMCTNEMNLDFTALCRLSLCCSTFHWEFHKVTRIYVDNPVLIFSVRYTKPVTFPRSLRFVRLYYRQMACECSIRVQQWWLQKLLFNENLHQCVLQCQRLIKRDWANLCRGVYSLARRRGEFCVPLHISVEGFKAHTQTPCRGAEFYRWVAEHAHLLFHASSRVHVNASDVEITSEWVLRQLLVD